MAPSTRRDVLIPCFLTLALIAPGCAAVAQTVPDGAADETFHFRMAVNEVGLTFHAADAHGLPVNDLKAGELKILDNGRPPRRVVAFDVMRDSPIRAAIIVDTSESMERQVAGSRAIALKYAQRVLRWKSDQALVMDFGYVSRITQEWTADPAALVIGVRQISAGKTNPLGGTTIFETLFRVCFNEFGKIDHRTTGNFILLFSDGQDNASHVSLEEAVDQCQRSNTAIYAFRSDPQGGAFSSGPKTLTDLAAQTGGRVFKADDSDAGIDADLTQIESDLRNQYRLVYSPAEIRADGSFHRIAVLGPERAPSINVRSGYYAPKQ